MSRGVQTRELDLALFPDADLYRQATHFPFQSDIYKVTLTCKTKVTY